MSSPSTRRWPRRPTGTGDGLSGEWECVTEEKDAEACMSACGGAGSASAQVYPLGAGGNPFSEPQCEVSCECENGTDVGGWIDPPEVQPSP